MISKLRYCKIISNNSVRIYFVLFNPENCAKVYSVSYPFVKSFKMCAIFINLAPCF